MWSSCFLRAAAALFAASTLGACDSEPPSGDPDEPAVGGGKADRVFGFDEGSLEARAILKVANGFDESTLDEDVGLDSRAAAGIVEQRPEPHGYPTLASVVEVDFVKEMALKKMLAFAERRGLVGRELSIATFNIRWFGLNGSFGGSFGSEERVETIRAFIDTHLGAHDVVVYQEIVDVDLFLSEVVPEHECVDYGRIGGKHQHVVLCHRSEYAFEPTDDDGDFRLEELRFSNLRPGVHGRLATQDGVPLANIVGVHLKAKPESTAKRLEQTEVLAEHVDALRESSNLPLVVLGDFNTHQARDTGLSIDDEIAMGELLEEHLRRVPLPVPNTFRKRDGTDFRLDQAFVSPEIEVVGVDVVGPCNLEFETGADAIDQYFTEVSDHCPVRVRLALP